jgi:hypothetical protein
MRKTQDLLQRLSGMNLIQLREEWVRLFGIAPSPSVSCKLLRLALAHRMQLLEGDATARWATIQKQATALPKMREKSGNGHAQRMRPGSRFLREYDGKVHEVLAVENGRFVYAGQVFHSLSEVARKITGTPRSGTVFFGLKRRTPGGEDA